MPKGGRHIDLDFVQTQRGLDRSWQTIAKMTGQSVHDLRAACDKSYQAPDLATAAARTPRQASGREGRPHAYTVPPEFARQVPPTSDTAGVRVHRERPVTQAQPAAAPTIRIKRLRTVVITREAAPEPQPMPTAISSPAQISTVAGDSRPTAGQVARALVAAALVMDENPALLGREPLRCRFPAMAALRVMFPCCDLKAMGRMLALDHAGTRLSQAKGSAWWPTLGNLALEASLCALEVPA